MGSLILWSYLRPRILVNSHQFLATFLRRFDRYLGMECTFVFTKLSLWQILLQSFGFAEDALGKVKSAVAHFLESGRGLL